MSVVETRVDGTVMVIVADNPPVNALSAKVRQGLDAAITDALADPAIEAIVIACEGRTFFAGADITEFGKPAVEPRLPQVIAAIEASEKPVVAAIHGTALGGGCELALGCHYRIAARSARLGTPEVQLGLLPGAGGTQRLPRLVGVANALEMVAIGQPVSAAKAIEIGLVDRLAEPDSLLADAIAFAREVAAVRPIPRICDKTATADQQLFDDFRQTHAKKFRGFDAPEANIRCVEAATRSSFVEGLAFERERFFELMNGSQSAAQRHIFFAQRKAARVDGIAEDTALRAIRKVGVIGAGTMGGGIAMNFLSAGIPVTIVESQREALDRCASIIRASYETSAAKGRIKSGQVEACMSLLTSTMVLDDLADCDLVIEAVFENLDIKKEIFCQLDAIVKRGAILASNTSYLDIDEIAAVTSRPGDVIGLHFFSPANVMKLLEVIRGSKTADDVVMTAMALARTIRKIAVVAGVCFGFIGNRMLIPRKEQAMQLLLEGASPAQIDKVHTEFGMPMGPFQMSDLAGVDIGWHRDTGRIENIRDALCAAGRWGQKSRAGYYDYDDKRRHSESKQVTDIVAGFRAKAGVTPREITTEEIVERTLYTIVNEGFRLLEEGIAQRASDIDVVWAFGYGWPVYRGGPMFWAGLEGPERIIAGLEKHKDRFGPEFRIAQTLRPKAVVGGGMLS
jgi:3-hydroxyacyl-CoA dehydrogenase